MPLSRFEIRHLSVLWKAAGLLSGLCVAGCGLVNQQGAALQSRDPGDIVGSQVLVLKDKVLYCFENFSTEAGGCKGQAARLSGSEITDISPFAGTCAMSGIDGSAKQGTPISLSCVQGGETSAAPQGDGQAPTPTDTRRGARTCFGQLGKSDVFKEDPLQNYGSGTWNVSSGRAGGSWAVSNVVDASNCDAVLEKTACQLKKKAAQASAGLHLTESSGGLESCWALVGDASKSFELSRCLAANADIEVFESGSLSEASQADGRRPDACFSLRPEGTYSVLAYRVSGDMKGVLAARAKVTPFDSTFAADLTPDFSSFVTLEKGTNFLGAYPTLNRINLTFQGTPDTSTGVWRASLGRVARFLPKGSCDSLYLGQSINEPISTPVSGNPSRPPAGGGGEGPGNQTPPGGEGGGQENPVPETPPAEEEC